MSKFFTLFLIFVSVNAVSQSRGLVDKSFRDSEIQSTITTVDHFTQQADGKILVAGIMTTQFGNGELIEGLARLNTNGSFDTSFVPYKTLQVSGIYLQQDQKILIGYFTGMQRLMANGAIDPTFKLFAGNVHHALVQKDDKIILTTPDLIRLTANGELDASFNTTQITSPAGIWETPTGDLLVPTYNANYSSYSIRKFSADGIEDTSFKTPVDKLVIDLNVLQDGRIAVIYSYIVGYEKLIILNANGTQDPSFSVPPGSYYRVTSDLQNRLYTGSNYLRRFNQDGSIDSSFNYPLTPEIQVMQIDKYDNLLIAESSKPISRILPDGSEDIGFSVHRRPYYTVYKDQIDEGLLMLQHIYNGAYGQDSIRIFKTDRNGNDDPAFHQINSDIAGASITTVHGDGRFVVSGFKGYSDSLSWKRFFANGIEDTLFTGGDYDDVVRLCALKNNDYIAVKELSSGYSLFRMKDNEPDPTFQSVWFKDLPYNITELSDGSILLIGIADPTQYLKKLIKILPNGGLDESFELEQNREILAFRVQKDGKLLVSNQDDKNTLRRYTSDGKLDTGFIPFSNLFFSYLFEINPVGEIVVVTEVSIHILSKDGIVEETLIDGNYALGIGSMIIQSENEIVLSGSFAYYNGIAREATVRLIKENGSGVWSLRSSSNKLSLYPNPASDEITISFNTYSSYSVFSVDGKLVQQGMLNGNRISVSELPTGVYVLELESKTGISKTRFLKQ